MFDIVLFFITNFADNSGATRKMGGFFKERLRELGGLDTICDLAAGCLRNIRVFIYNDNDLVFPHVVKLKGVVDRLKIDGDFAFLFKDFANGSCAGTLLWV